MANRWQKGGVVSTTKLEVQRCNTKFILGWAATAVLHRVVHGSDGVAFGREDFLIQLALGDGELVRDGQTHHVQLALVRLTVAVVDGAKCLTRQINTCPSATLLHLLLLLVAPERGGQFAL